MFVCLFNDVNRTRLVGDEDQNAIFNGTELIQLVSHDKNLFHLRKLEGVFSAGASYTAIILSRHQLQSLEKETGN